jgi:hypothetical protein
MKAYQTVRREIPKTTKNEICIDMIDGGNQAGWNGEIVHAICKLTLAILLTMALEFFSRWFMVQMSTFSLFPL